MDWLKSLYPQVREVLEKSMPDYWPGLRHTMERLFEKPIMPEVVLPLASCRAVGGDAKDAVHIAAAILSLAACWRLYDDLEDQDREGGLWQQVGPARAWNFASAVHILSFEILNEAPLANDRFRMINRLLIDSFLYLAAGQDRDLAGMTKGIEDYRLTIEMKTGCAYAAACISGAMVGTEDPKLYEACHTFGHHLGMSKQILNDLESIWCPDGVTDLNRGKVTLPLVYGMCMDHPDRDELISLVQHDQVMSNSERIRQILDKIDTRNFLLCSALEERTQALNALEVCPDAEGKRALEAYITGLFGDLEVLEQKEE
jgi:geranylgeranyl diphosphate synthase type I